MTATSYADVFLPPSWEGQERTTHQVWEFSTGDRDPVADEYIGPFDPRPASIRSASWRSLWEGREGVWEFSGIMEVPIVNFPEPLPEKIVWIQLTWMPNLGGSPAVPNVEAWPLTADGQIAGDSVAAEVVFEQPVDQGPWMHTAYEIRLRPNPEMEMVKINQWIYVDQVVIDTWCVPEPGAMAILLVGGVIAIRGRRR
jgi:hypothetical protein